MAGEHIRVVHYNTTFLRLTENWIYRQVIGLDGSSTKFYSLDRINSDTFAFDNLRCLRQDLSYLPLLFNRACNRVFHRYPQFLWWLWKDKPHIIHAHFGPCGYQILPYARLLRLPLITSFYGYDAYVLPEKELFWSEGYKQLFERGQLFLAEGPAMRAKLIKLGCPTEKVVIHHVGIEPSGYEFRARRPDHQIRLMICGRLVEKKGIPYAIEAVKRLLIKYGGNICLTIVGDSDEDGSLTDEKRKILSSIKRYKLEEAVNITGYVSYSELIEMIYDHHILLVPSVHASDGDAEGGFPVVLTEALATGMPVVAFDHCDIPEIVKDGKSGFLAPERDLDAFVEKLAYLIEHPEIWPDMGRTGREYVNDHYDIAKLNMRLVEIYRELASSRLLYLHDSKHVRHSQVM